ncbi:MAG: tRNA (guanosine(46)-N7)-methyltransferase TrmB [Saccharofermentans sp.]|nr:tRNA (guanosine(46)-N7)-methyltransferase TrmB [Mageeibacillus sp.]MCI1264219.1 tRNA (guanosine(46)-N7)-methyltransferase TrmB [Saccharofermentans sp.]MCI1274984.1 tRNA (guanosine(46)-N7)-methyltransferase TrmB [Saccharofermentans sp.]MCI2044270.1 tRNA (guanosine(46)-N7)-methyltransferase TrmB [Mageeibacillus sp.]
MSRMRAKRNIPARMDRCHAYWFEAPMLNKGKWRQACGFAPDAKLWLEIGCGKGRFCTQMAQRNPDILYIAMERDASVTLAAVENASNLELKNIFFINGDAGLIENYFGEEEVDCLYLNFSDPWTRQNKPKRRLTYRDFLEKYKVMMKPGAKLCFKTDNDELFDFSLEEFRHCGFTLTELTRDLHNSEYDPDNVRTEFEQKFADQGINIKRVVACL